MWELKKKRSESFVLLLACAKSWRGLFSEQVAKAFAFIRL